jgi:hypothetical protein
MSTELAQRRKLFSGYQVHDISECRDGNSEQYCHLVEDWGVEGAYVHVLSVEVALLCIRTPRPCGLVGPPPYGRRGSRAIGTILDSRNAQGTRDLYFQSSFHRMELSMYYEHY